MDDGPDRAQVTVGRVDVVDATPQEDRVERMAREVRESLSASPPWVPSKYFYDERGAALFEEITRLPEYYPTRTEAEILDAHADEIVARVAPRELFELGSGSGRKTRRLVVAGKRAGALEALTFFDVNRAGLRSSLASMAREFPGLSVRGVVGDFSTDLGSVPPADSRFAVFLGGTIGNLDPDREVPAFLASIRTLLTADGALLVGVDLEKDVVELERAYNDARGVTAEFNRNVLRVLDRELGADFGPERFEHVAFYDRERHWIEMRLRATQALHVRIPRCGIELSLAKGDEVRTEISCKYTRGSLETRLEGSGLALDGWWTDARGRFALALLRPTR